MGEEERRDPPRAWERTASERLAGFGMFDVRRDRARHPDTGEEHDFHIVEAPDGVAVVALTEDGCLVMVEQYRHPLRGVTLEVPAGVTDEGESPLEAARRELREETGYGGPAGEHVGTLELNPSWQTTRVDVVVLRGVRRSGSTANDAGEDTRVRILPADEVARLVADGGIRSSVTVAALALWRALPSSSRPWR